jgi:hypothetical protein
MSDLDPKTFDFDEWLSGAKLPEHSVEVYARADLLAVADDLIRRISQAETDEELERSLHETIAAAELRERYEAVMEEFKASALTFRVRAVKDSETAVLDAKVERGEIRKEDRPLHEIAVASVEPKLTFDQVQRMREVIGPAQITKVWNAVFRATGEQPEVSPAFLPRRSGQGSGRE